MDARMLTRDEGEALYSFEGKHVVRLDSANDSGHYREWLVGVHHTQYCIINEGDVWTLMVQLVPGNARTWVDAPGDVETFLRTHQLILAA
jgi:hypothetical protein